MSVENKILEGIVGSRAYGTDTPESDTDIKGIYVQDINEVLGLDYKPQVDVSKDTVFYEVKRYLELAKSANPNILELLYLPDHCIITSTWQYDLLKFYRDKFLTKQCLKTFGGYAVGQIKKAKGLDKKMNWEKGRVSRKSVIDFVYTYHQGKTMPVLKFLEGIGVDQSQCGLTKLNHFPDCYALYTTQFEIPEKAVAYKGIVGEDSNEVRLSSIPKGRFPITIVHFQRNSYSQHCKDYKEYQDWLKNRNEARYVDTTKHGQKVDGKNLMHCIRLLDMAKEIAERGTLSVERPNREYLLSIRRGEVDLDSLIYEVEERLLELDSIYDKSGLPDSCDKGIVNDLLLEIRWGTSDKI